MGKIRKYKVLDRDNKATYVDAEWYNVNHGILEFVRYDHNDNEINNINNRVMVATYNEGTWAVITLEEK